MVDLLSAYKCFWSNVIASSIFVFEFCYFYFYTYLIYRFTTFEVAITLWCHLINLYFHQLLKVTKNQLFIPVGGKVMDV